MIINCIILRTQLRKEHPRQIPYLPLLILKTLRHLPQLPLNLHLPRQNKECQRHKTRSLHTPIGIIKPSVQEIRILINEMVKAHGHVAERDDRIGARDGVRAALENGNEEREVLLAVLCGDAHELCEGESRGALEGGRGVEGVIAADFGDEGSEVGEEGGGAVKELAFADVGYGFGEVVFCCATYEVELVGFFSGGLGLAWLLSVGGFGGRWVGRGLGFLGFGFAALEV